jgi:tRNA1Val (adenine37-N6)-methyltransferase
MERGASAFGAAGMSMGYKEPANETLDTLLQGKLKFYQSRSGYRVSLDAVLLAYFVTLREEDVIADLGTGNGAIAMILARMQRSRSIVGVEIQPAMAERAEKNIKLNRLESRIRIVCADLRAITQSFKPGSFSLVTANPPYRKAASGRVSPQAEKKIARHEISATLNDFVTAGAYLLPAKGRMALIYPATRSIDLMAAMRDAAIEPKRLQMVHSFASAEASLILIEGVKGGRGGLAVLAPLVIYDSDKRYTAAVQAMLAGEQPKQ